MARTAVTVTGLRELDKSLGELGKRNARAVLKRTAVKALEPMMDRARQLAPTEHFHLVRSITISTEKPHLADAGKAAFAETLSAGGTRSEAAQALRAARAGDSFAEAFMGPGRHPQAIMQEYGTVDHGPQSYMRPAFDAEAPTAVEIIKSDLAQEIDKTARRVAARKARRGG